ncbi:MAG: hypothetical protein LBK61_00565 [Spirochaetaceae bacterium]|nr:hypothetical protein [Spirochaetaceae bacterium]
MALLHSLKIPAKTGRGRGVPGSGGAAADPAMDAKGRPHMAETARNIGSPLDLSRSTASKTS